MFYREGWGELFPQLTLSTGEDIAIFRTADALALLAHPSHVLVTLTGIHCVPPSCSSELFWDA